MIFLNTSLEYTSEECFSDGPSIFHHWNNVRPPKQLSEIALQSESKRYIYIYQLCEGRHQEDTVRACFGLNVVGTESVCKAVPTCQCLRMKKINLPLILTYWKPHSHFPLLIPFNYNKSQFLIHSRKGCQIKHRTLGETYISDKQLIFFSYKYVSYISWEKLY